MKTIIFLIITVMLFYRANGQTQDFVINLTVSNLDTGNYKIKLEEIVSMTSSSTIFNGSVTRQKNSLKIKGSVLEERYVFFSISRFGGFDFGIGPGDTANIELIKGNNNDNKFLVSGSKRVVQSVNYINRTNDSLTSLLRRQNSHIDSLNIARASDKKIGDALHTYDSIYHSIFLYNINYADTVGSSVAATVALLRHANDTGRQDILSHIKSARIRFGNLVTVQSLQSSYHFSPFVANTLSKKDTLHIARSFETDFEKKISSAFKNNKLVLIDFWASWCKPCIDEFPVLRKAYDSYRKRGFEIISISFDESKVRWTEAKKRFSTNWKIHLLDTAALNSRPAKTLAIKSIPRNYLIDKNGIIYGKNLRGAALAEMLSKLL
ncbi:MAG: TlpA disulfide reductase family protein [Chitinophagaceae bacterium]